MSDGVKGLIVTYERASRDGGRMKSFDIALGSVLGTTHFMAGRANQDAVVLLNEEDVVVAVVCDGVSEGAHSDVGAKLGARMAANLLQRHIRLCKVDQPDWRTIYTALCNRLREMLDLVGGERRTLVNECFLFTLLAAVITPRRTSFAAIGDGELWVNGTRFPLGPFPGNMPPTLAYSVVGSSLPHDQLAFRQVAELDTDDLESFLLGTDGAGDLATLATEPIPGSGTPIGPLSRLWTEPAFTEKPMRLQRHLTLVNGGVLLPYQASLPAIDGGAPDVDHRVSKRAGKVGDDVTIVVGRRARHG